MKEVERINKSVLTAHSIEIGNSGWSLSQKDNPVLCYYCKSPLFYVGIEGWYLRGHIKELAVRQLLVEAEKIIDLGINPKDCRNPRNAIFNVGENKMYLFDFGEYKFIEEPGNHKKIRKEIKVGIQRWYI